MPKEIFDAAFVDGCSYIQFYFRFTLPLSTPILATVSVITLTGSWNNYLLPLIMINDEFYIRGQWESWYLEVSILLIGEKF